MIKKKIKSKLIHFLLENDKSIKEDIDLYDYSFEILWALLIPFIMMLPISIMTKSSYKGYLLLLSFTYLRRVCAGFHFKSEYHCFVFSLALLFATVWVGMMLDIEVKTCITILTICQFSLCLLGNLLNKKFGVSTNYPTLLARVSFCSSLCILLSLLNFIEIAKWLMLGILMTALLQYPLYISCQIRKNKH